MSLVGYARVSRADQSLDLQIDALLKAGCMRHTIFSDKITGIHSKKPGLLECLESLKEGDTLIVYRLDRLGRTTKDLISLIAELRKRGIYFKSLQEGLIDTSSANGELIFHLFATLAGFERSLIKERTLEGLKAARKRGRVGGRPLITEANNSKIAAVKNMYGKMTVKEICSSLKISIPTVYRYLKR